VQAFPSSHAVPSEAGGLVQAPVAGSHVPARWHESSAAHPSGFAPRQDPPTHASVCVQGLPSLQAEPSAFTGREQAPVARSQVPGSWQSSIGTQRTGLDPVHCPTRHVSVCVHGFPSSQPVPSALAGVEQAPVAGSQVPASWHWSGVAQVTGVVPIHVPVRHVSTCVQAFPSAQAEPSGFIGWLHAPVEVLQTPAR
jgi:hypothetical protein